MFQGVYTAIITPFREGKVDEKKLEELVAMQVGAGVHGVVTCGTTGEALYLSLSERIRINEICVGVCKDKAKVIAGTGALSAEEAIGFTQAAQKAGVNGALVINPWYVKPSQEGLYRYYKTISENVCLPLLLYNNPSRTGVEISLETIMRLSSFKNIQGIKDASSCLQRVPELRGQLGDHFNLLAGNDDTLAAYLAMGGDEGILVASNVAPSLFVALVKAWKEEDLNTFKTTWESVYPLASALSVERIKYAMALVHRTSLETRLPYAPLDASTQEIIEAALEGIGLWKPLVSVRTR